MPSILQRAELSILRVMRRPALSGVAERGLFWFTFVLLALVTLDAISVIREATFIIAMLVVVPIWAIFVSIVVYRWLVGHVLWKVRNRLVVTYVLMGLTPVVLFVTLAVVAAYVLSGQFATFAASSDLDGALARLGAQNLDFSAHAAHALLHTPDTRSLDLADYEGAVQAAPGHLTVDAWRDGRPVPLSVEGKPVPHQDLDGPMAYPGWSKDGFRSIVQDGERLYLRAVNTRTVQGHAITTVSSLELDSPTVGELAQGLGVIHVIPNVEPPTHHEEGVVTGGTLPDAAFLLDRRITFSAPLQIASWKDGKPLRGLLNVTSRPALLYARLFGTAVVVGTIVRYVLFTLAAVFAVLELIAFVMAVRLNRTITRAVGDLYRATTAIDGGDFGYRIQVPRRDQLGALSNSFNTMAESLERLLEQQREKERMQSELEIAQEVQNNLFPHEQLRMPGLEVHGICKPARTVSGDYYDFLLMGDSELCLAIGDISGKGISAALLMASLHSAVRAYRFAGEECLDDENGAREVPQGVVTFSSPGKVLRLLNRHLFRSTQAEKYATLFLAHYNTHSRRLVYSNGGQLPPIVLCANGTMRRLDRGGSVVGLLDNMSYEEGEVTLDEGDILIAYSDGVTEPENEFGEFGEARLIEAVQRHRHLPLSAISHHVMQSLRAWIGDQEQPDDITLVLARQASAG